MININTKVTICTIQVSNSPLLNRLFVYWMRQIASKQKENEPCTAKAGFYSSKTQKNAKDRIGLKVGQIFKLKFFFLNFI